LLLTIHCSLLFLWSSIYLHVYDDSHVVIQSGRNIKESGYTFKRVKGYSLYICNKNVSISDNDSSYYGSLVLRFFGHKKMHIPWTICMIQSIAISEWHEWHFKHIQLQYKSRSQKNTRKTEKRVNPGLSFS